MRHGLETRAVDWVTVRWDVLPDYDLRVDLLATDIDPVGLIELVLIDGCF